MRGCASQPSVAERRGRADKVAVQSTQARSMLYLIGLGLYDHKDITLRGLEAVKTCSKARGDKLPRPPLPPAPPFFATIRSGRMPLSPSVSSSASSSTRVLRRPQVPECVAASQAERQRGVYGMQVYLEMYTSILMCGTEKLVRPA